MSGLSRSTAWANPTGLSARSARPVPYGNTRRCVPGAYSLALLAPMVVLAAGCSSHRVPPGVVELTFAHGVSVDTDPVFQRALDDFMAEHPKIRVRRVGIAADYYPKLLVMIAGNTAPDVMWMGQGFGEFAQRGAFLRIDREVTKGIKLQDYYTSVVDWYRFHGELYGFPYGIDCQMIYYNRDLFRRAGVPFPMDDWRLDGFLDTALRLMRSRVARDIPGFYAFRGSIDRGAFGARMLSPDYTQCWLDRPESIAALQFNVDLKNRYHVSPSMAQGTEGALDSNQAFKIGRVAMLMGATWDLPSFHKEIKSFDWDAVLPPGGKARSTWASSSGIAIYARTPHPREATLLLQQLVAPRFQFDLCRYSGCFPTHRPTARRWVKETPPPPRNLEAFLKAVPYLNPNPRIFALNEILQRMYRADERALLGRASTEDALRDATRQINAILERQRRRQGVREEEARTRGQGDKGTA